MWQIDQLIIRGDRALRTIAGISKAGRPNPAQRLEEAGLSPAEVRHSAGLMRVNHVGEVCAQALYDAQAWFAQSEKVRDQFLRAGQEEEDHLAWTAQRLKELGSHTSLLNPLWYAGAFALGAAAARIGDATSLGFVVETERQVEAHLNSHLDSLPAQDARSRAIVEQMRVDEVEHGAEASKLGAKPLSVGVQAAMRAMAKVMTTAAYYI